jgi:hypothetical protein
VPATIEIPMLPDRALSPNSRVNWREKARAAKDLRDTARLATIESRMFWNGNTHGMYAMDVEIQWCCGRRSMDDDNAWASLKAARDGIADELFGGEDRYITQGKLVQTRGDGSIRVTLRGMDW